MYFFNRYQKRALIGAASLPLLFSGCADLGIAKHAYNNGQYEEARAHWTVLAEKGFPQAEAGLGKLLLATQGDAPPSERAYEQALSHFQSAYDKGYQAAAFDIGLTHLKQAADTQSDAHYQKAYQWLTIASNNGQKNAAVHLANMQLKGLGTPQDVDAALATLKTLADDGNGRAARQLGQIYAEGQYLEQDDKQAANWYRQAIELGELSAEIKLARLYETSQSNVQDTARALTLYEKVAKRNNLTAAYRLARLLERLNGPNEQSRHWYHFAAQQGHAASQLRQADITLESQASPQAIQDALNTYQRLSAQKNGAASHRLGQAHEKGLGVPENFQQAFQWYQKALNQGYVRAELSLARLYANGWGVTQDIDTARDIFQRFAQQGNAVAAYHLAELLHQAGEKTAAYQWYETAANANYLPAQYKFGILLSQSNNRRDLDRSKQYLSAAAAKGDHRATLYLGQKIFSGWRKAPDKVTGLALVLTAARHNTQGAVAEAVILMDKMYSSRAIEKANDCSRQRYMAGDIPPINGQCVD